ncbi:hypothetical protein [Chromatium okenii]|uniref:hypothetical protein n=1 Tax=Chromatium okenii TaxID=61644 RepID=UPI0026EB5204|nr:hypothetical protein [Chromatium okenii]MBV5311510.1 hypothetical protein [Chromatium okenii]
MSETPDSQSSTEEHAENSAALPPITFSKKGIRLKNLLDKTTKIYKISLEQGKKLGQIVKDIYDLITKHGGQLISEISSVINNKNNVANESIQIDACNENTPLSSVQESGNSSEPEESRENTVIDYKSDAKTYENKQQHKPVRTSKSCSNRYLLTVIYADRLGNSCSIGQISQERIKTIVSQARFMKVFSDEKAAEYVLNGFTTSDEAIDYSQSINIVLLIEVSGTDDLLNAGLSSEFELALNPEPNACATIIAVKRLESIVGVRQALHALV